MILRTIEPAHFGPFAHPATLELDEQCTVLTGPNDAGKSYALLAIEMLCTGQSTTEEHVNADRFGEYGGKWQDDPEIQATATFEVDSYTLRSKMVTGSPIKAGDLIEIESRLNQAGAAFKVRSVKREGTEISVGNTRVLKAPNIITLPDNAKIRNTVDLNDMTEMESDFLRLGFGHNFAVTAYRSIRPDWRAIRISQAQEKLNQRLQEVLPKSLPLEFRLYDIGGMGNELSLTLADPHQAHVPIGARGEGIRRLLTLMGTLLQVNDHNQSIILLDEPETSLHADAQHQLRRVLEKVAANPRIQVVYATHSPSMINPMRPNSVRVFERTHHKEKATTIIHNNAYGDNFQRVRISLGLTPADSLLYGCISIFVEGDTEVRCLEPLLTKLHAGGIKGFDDLNELLSECHFICGEGDNIQRYCRIAKSQNVQRVILLDGDKKQLAEKIRQSDPDAEIIELRDGTEFEELIPRQRYIEAVAGTAQGNAADLTLESFDQWVQKKRVGGMFSKQVEHWARDVAQHTFNKHLVMEKAIELASPEEIVADEPRELVAAIRKALTEMGQ